MSKREDDVQAQSQATVVQKSVTPRQEQVVQERGEWEAGGASVFADCELEASCHGGAPIMPFALISLKILQKPLLLSDPRLTDGLSPLLLCSGYI